MLFVLESNIKLLFFRTSPSVFTTGLNLNPSDPKIQFTNKQIKILNEIQDNNFK